MHFSGISATHTAIADCDAEGERLEGQITEAGLFHDARHLLAIQKGRSRSWAGNGTRRCVSCAIHVAVRGMMCSTIEAIAPPDQRIGGMAELEPQ